MEAKESADQSLGTCGFTLEMAMVRDWPEGESWSYVLTERCNWPLDYSSGSGKCPIHNVMIPIVRGNAV